MNFHALALPILNVASCRAALVSQRPCILAFVLSLMAGMLVSGVVSIEDGAAQCTSPPGADQSHDAPSGYTDSDKGSLAHVQHAQR